MTSNYGKQQSGSAQRSIESKGLSTAYLAFAELVGHRIAENWRAHAKAANGSLIEMGAQVDRESTPSPHSMNTADSQTE